MLQIWTEFITFINRYLPKIIFVDNQIMRFLNFMAKKLYIVLPVFLSLFGSKLSAQDSVKTPYFPYQTGDFWVNEIYIAGQYETDERIDIISDSVTPNGEYVFTVSSERGQPEELIYNFKIDS